MTSIRKQKRRHFRWGRYIEKTARSSQQHYDYPFGLRIKVTSGNFGRRREMRRRDGEWYRVQRMAGELFR